MLDGLMRRIVDPPLGAAARRLVRAGVGADTLTAAALVFGLISAGAVAFGQFGLALICLAVCRIGDGLDGAVARETSPTDCGGFLDIVADFIFYGAIPMAFAVLDPSRNALWGAFLLFTFYVNGATFLAYAAIAARRGSAAQAGGDQPGSAQSLTAKSLHYTAGLAEGSETILAFSLMMLLPAQFPVIAMVFGFMCLVTAGSRIAQAASDFRPNSD